MVQRKRSYGNRSSSQKRKHRQISAKNRAESRRYSLLKKPLAWPRFQSPHLPLIILILITFIAYANAWPNNLVMDDVTFAVPERFQALGLTDIFQFFTEDLWASTGAESGLYRPLLLISIMMDVHLFGDWVAGYHLTNILLHVLATVMVYGLTRHLGIRCGGGVALSSHIAILAALIFGVHPIHTEAVNSIFNRSEILVTIGVAGGLWWFLRMVGIKPAIAWSGLGLVYLLVLFCRENGVVLPALAVTALWLTSDDKWLVRTRKCLPVFFLLIPLMIYLGLRINALNVNDIRAEVTMVDSTVQVDQSTAEAEVEKPDEIGPVSEYKDKNTLSKEVSDIASGLFDKIRKYRYYRLLRASNLAADSLKAMIFPYPLLVFHDPPKTGKWLALLLHATLLCVAVLMYFKKRPDLLVGLVFFYLALMPSSRIIGEPWAHPILAERNLYLPSVGLCIALAFGLTEMVKRYNLRSAVVLISIITLIFLPMCWTRNAEWASDILLDEAEYSRGPKRGRIIQALIVDHTAAGSYPRASELCDKYSARRSSDWVLNLNCGEVYSQTGRYRDAEQAYFRAIGDDTGPSMVHHSLAGLYLRLGRKSDAKRQYEKAIEAEDIPFFKEVRAAVMLLDLYPSNRARLLEARQHAQRAISMQPQSQDARQILAQIDARLNR